MKLWIKCSLAGLAVTTLIWGGLAASGYHGEHAKGWNDERIDWAREKAMDMVGSKLDLNADQKQFFSILADELIVSSKALRGERADPLADFEALMAGDTFSRFKAQALLDQKIQVMQDNGPKILKAFGDFYDSLNAVQQKEVRERFEKRSHGW